MAKRMESMEEQSIVVASSAAKILITMTELKSPFWSAFQKCQPSIEP